MRVMASGINSDLEPVDKILVVQITWWVDDITKIGRSKCIRAAPDTMAQKTGCLYSAVGTYFRTSDDD